MHLVCYLCEDYHDARSLEHKVRVKVSQKRDGTPRFFRLRQTLQEEEIQSYCQTIFESF
jgi:hypothetical protein